MSAIKKLENTINDLENLIRDAKEHLNNLKTYKKPNLRIMIPSPIVTPCVSPKYMGNSPQIENYPLAVPVEEWRNVPNSPPTGYVYEYTNLASIYGSPRMGYKVTKIHK